MGENMRISRKIIISLFVASVIYSVFVMTVDTVYNRKSQNPEPKYEISTESEIYRVKAHENRIAVFIDGENSPLYTLDTPLLTDLPEYDRELLQNGLTAKSKTELLKILEDYDN